MEEQGLLLTSPQAADFAAASSDANNLGVTLSLSAEVASRLRQHQPQDVLHNNKEPPKLTFLSPKNSSQSKHIDDESVDENEKTDHGKVGISLLGPDADPLDNWNEVLPLTSPATGGGAVGEDAVEDKNEENENDDGTKNVSTDDDWSVSPDPPPHMPVVVVSVKRLVGYIPKQQADKEQLEHQVHAALWYGSAEAANMKQGGNPQEDAEQVLDAAQHFDERVTELMQSGLATHSTTAEQQQQSNQQQDDHNEQQQVVVVSYPEFLCQPRDSYATDDNFAPRTVLATATCWKRLLKPHPIPVVATLLKHLQNCNRSLVWKYQMHKELVHLARTEKQAKIRRHQSKALREWKLTKREHQLEQLYQVRETLEHRLEMAVSKVHELESVRDQAVAMEIRKRRVDNMGLGGLVACDLNSTILAFPDAQSTWLGLEGEEEDDGYYDDQIGPSFVSDEDDEDYYGGESDGGGCGGGYEAEGDAEDEDDASQSEARTTAITASSQREHDITNFPRRDNKASRAKVAKKRRRRLEEAAKEAEHQSKLDQARTEEAKVRELCTTTDLKMAQAIRAALERKMESVDELLESLQEEAWADEEAQENGEELVPEAEEDEDSLESSRANEFSLLDQVLAMILGSLHPPRKAFENNDEDDEARLREKHTQKLQAEHDKIVKEWKVYFGRLPPSLLSPPEADEEVTKATKAIAKAKAESDRQTELRTAYGIEENEGGDWDADSGDDKEDDGADMGLVSGQAPASTPEPAPKPQRVGLRPGGRARR